MATVAKAAGTMGPAWKQFIKTKFFVAIQRSPDDDPKNFFLYVSRESERGRSTLTISEVRGRLDPDHGDGLVSLSGADILCRLEDHSAIQVALREGAFSISGKRADWLRSGIKMTKERIAIRKRLLAAAFTAPLPVLAIKAGSESEVALPPEPVLPPLASILEIPYLKAVALGVAAAGVIVAIYLGTKETPEIAKAPVAHEAPVMVPAAAAPTPAAAKPTEVITTFSPADNSFTVNVPGMVEEVELSPDQVAYLGERRMHQYRLMFDGRLYTMETIDYMANPPYDPNAEMDVIQQSIVGGDGSLIRSKPISLRGATGREVRVRLPDGGERAARFAFVGSKFAQVMVTAPPGERSAVQIDAYLNSFQLR